MIGGAAQVIARRTVQPLARATAIARHRHAGEAPPSLAETADIVTPANTHHPFSPAATGRPPFGQPSAAFLAHVIALRADVRPATAAALAAERRAAVAAYCAQTGDYAHILGPVRPFAFRA